MHRAPLNHQPSVDRWDRFQRRTWGVFPAICAPGVVYGLVDVMRSEDPDWPFLLQLTGLFLIGFIQWRPVRGWRFALLLVVGAALTLSAAYLRQPAVYPSWWQLSNVRCS